MTDSALRDAAHARPTGTAGGAKTFQTDLWRIYLPAVVGFAVLSITNPTILSVLARHHALYGAGRELAEREAKTAEFFLVPLKALLFALSTAILGFELIAPAKRMAKQLTAPAILQTLVAMAAGLALTWTVVPLGMGREYARVSIDPFSQVPGQLYRRLLLPGLAYIVHLNGFLYIILVWAFVLAAVLAAKVYLLSKGHRLSLLEEVSLLTVGIFVTAFQVPGNPEVAVFLFALIALADFERSGKFGGVQLAALCLALMAHEACAVIVFGPMVLFLFPKKSWIPCLAVGAIYGLLVVSNFSFDLRAPLQIQSMVSDIPARVVFRQSPAVDLAAVFFAFKLLWVLVLIGIFHYFRKSPRTALFVLAGFGLAIGSMYIGVDYTRLVGFATIAMLVCYHEAAKHLSRRALMTVVALNLLVPSIFVSGGVGLTPFNGLYVYSGRWIVHLLGLRP